MRKYNNENMEKLAEEVVNSWDMDTLMNYALQQLVSAYENDITLFNSDCGLMYGE
jgi:hypothetical protein